MIVLVIIGWYALTCAWVVLMVGLNWWCLLGIAGYGFSFGLLLRQERRSRAVAGPPRLVPPSHAR